MMHQARMEVPRARRANRAAFCTFLQESACRSDRYIVAVRASVVHYQRLSLRCISELSANFSDHGRLITREYTGGDHGSVLQSGVRNEKED
jgi:hypothetical protein